MNELPLNFFILLVIIQALAILYTVLTMKPDFPHVFASSTAAFLGFVNANMILNGNVVMIAATTSTTTYIPIQSLPVHYILLGFAVIMSVITGYMVLSYVYQIMNAKGEGTFNFEGFND